MASIDEAPDVSELIALMLPTTIQFEGKPYTIEEWRRRVLNEVRTGRKQGKMVIFNKYVSGLLEGYGTRGEYQENQRRQLMSNRLLNFLDVTKENVYQILVENKKFGKEKGVRIVMGAKEIVEPDSFDWEDYFKRAEAHYTDGFKNDDFLKIKGIGSTTKVSKTRDYAISQFSEYYCAIDRNVARLLTRTGLILHGYGELTFGTSATENYEFMKLLIDCFSKDFLGWEPISSKGYSPKEIDAMFWLFASNSGICRSEPQCNACPINKICLRYRVIVTSNS